jgi:hypothetical protein
MTVASETARNNYIGTGTTGPFAYNFRVFQDADLLVTKADSDGVETTLTLTTDYTVTGAGSYNGGNVTLVTALAIGETLSIRRVIGATQGADLPNQGGYFPEVVEAALDRLTFLIQQMKDEYGRGLRLPETEAPSDLLTILPPLAERKGRTQGYDATTGQPVMFSTANTAVSAAMEAVVQSATLALARAALGPWGDAVLTATDRTLLAQQGDVINVKNYPYLAVGNGVADDTTAIQAALTAAAVSGGSVFLPPGTYLCGQISLTSKARVRISGAGYASVLKLTGTPTQNIQAYTTWLLLDTCTQMIVDHLRFDCNNLEHVAIGIMGCTDVLVDGCYIHNSPGTIGDSRPAIIAHSSAAVRVVNNHLYDVSTWFSFGLSTTLGQITDSVFANNVCRNAKATSAANCTRSVIANNVFDTSLYCGIELNGSAAAAMTDWSVIGNTFKGCVAPCLQVSGLAAGGQTRDGVISGNTFVGGLDAAIYAFGDVYDVTIGDNIIRDCAKGIALTVNASGGCKRFQIHDNKIYDTRAGGSRTMTVGIELAMGTSGAGAITGEALADIDIVDNQIRNTTDAGIGTTYTSGAGTWARCRISRNRANNCDYGIKIGTGNPTACWTAMELSGNRTADNATAGIRMSIDPGDINTWTVQDNFGALAYNSPYIFGGLGGVPALLGLRSTATPEGAIVGGIGSTCHNLAGGAGTSFYVKQTATVNTGWAGK